MLWFLVFLKKGRVILGPFCAKRKLFDFGIKTFFPFRNAGLGKTLSTSIVPELPSCKTYCILEVPEFTRSTLFQT